MRNVPAFWKKAVLDGSISKLAELSNKNPDGILGVSVYNNPEDIYYYIAVPVEQHSRARGNGRIHDTRGYVGCF